MSELDPTPLAYKTERSESGTYNSPAMTSTWQGSSPRSAGTAGQHHELPSKSNAPLEIATSELLYR
jgi:hypothetical protein